MKVLLTGSQGQLGQAIVAASHQQSNITELFALNRQQLDITNPEAIKQTLLSYQPDVVINCAAYTAVEQAEQDADNCFLINAEAVAFLAEQCHNEGILLMHFSTDYVFDGKKIGPYTENDIPNPLNIYGKSKQAGELAIQQTCEKYLILRTSWLFSEYGHNFYLIMQKLAQQQQTIKVVNDQIGGPTYAGNLAFVVMKLLQQYQQYGSLVYGLYHYCDQPYVSWYQFARAILTEKPVSILPVSATQYTSSVPRPQNSRLCIDKLKSQLSLGSKSWQHSIQQLNNK